MDHLRRAGCPEDKSRRAAYLVVATFMGLHLALPLDRPPPPEDPPRPDRPPRPDLAGSPDGHRAPASALAQAVTDLADAVTAIAASP